MPLVFVHGVNVRNDAEYYGNLKVRNGLFRKFALNGIVADPATVAIENPYWGQYGARFSWNHASLPEAKYEQFGSADSIFEEVLAEIAPGIAAEPNKLLIAVAQQKSLITAVDCIWAAAAYFDSGQDVAEELASLAVPIIQYAQANDKPGWLKKIANDDQFIENLLTEAEAFNASDAQTSIESFGISTIWNHLKITASGLSQSVTGIIAAGTVKAIRPWAHHRASLFLGDVFKYLNERGTVEFPGAIVREVGNAFQRAAEKKSPTDDKLIIVAHSMGGNITYDILTHFLPKLECDLLLTVGSQVGVFEELKLFRISREEIPSSLQSKVIKPANIKRWINVFDPADSLGYAIERIFSDVKDYQFSTGASPLSAHSMYFYRPSFHQRLRERIMESHS